MGVGSRLVYRGELGSPGGRSAVVLGGDLQHLGWAMIVERYRLVGTEVGQWGT